MNPFECFPVTHHMSGRRIMRVELADGLIVPVSDVDLIRRSWTTPLSRDQWIEHIRSVRRGRPRFDELVDRGLITEVAGGRWQADPPGLLAAMLPTVRRALLTLDAHHPKSCRMTSQTDTGIESKCVAKSKARSLCRLGLATQGGRFAKITESGRTVAEVWRLIERDVAERAALEVA